MPEAHSGKLKSVAEGRWAQPILRAEDSPQFDDQGRQIVLHNRPQDVQIDVVVAVDQPVPQTDDAAPRYALPSVLGFGGDVSRCLPCAISVASTA